MKLNQLSDCDGARKPARRVGRGIGSGKGKTCGRGTKGQKSRSGVAIKGFEGGQMPLHRRLPKRGFNPFNPKRLSCVNLDRLQTAIDAGKLDNKITITATELLAAGVIRRVHDGVKLLGRGKITGPLKLEIAAAARSAQAAIAEAGGQITFVTGRSVSDPAD